jgi:Arc/MetJ-type ribon-helix-helix transcriptional regulator
MVHTQIQLTEKQMAALEELAQKRHLSLSDLIQEGIEHLLQSAVIPSKAEQKQRALAIAGRFKSGRGDLARRHDDYVAEAFEA